MRWRQTTLSFGSAEVVVVALGWETLDGGAPAIDVVGVVAVVIGAVTGVTFCAYDCWPTASAGNASKSDRAIKFGLAMFSVIVFTL